MTEQEWLASTDPQAMLRLLTAWDSPLSRPSKGTIYASDRKLRLWVEACREMDGLQYFTYDLHSQEGLQDAIGAWSVSQISLCSMPTRAALLRDIFGNPYRGMPIFAVHRWENGRIVEQRGASWLYWSDGTVPKIAQAIYQDRNFADMPILADALEEAGCDSADILDHCRGPVPHFRGCWVLDLLLGKE